MPPLDWFIPCEQDGLGMEAEILSPVQCRNFMQTMAVRLLQRKRCLWE